MRKCSASTVDLLASVYGDDLLLSLLPLVNALIFNKEWTQREAGILALGAIAEGCAQGMEQHLSIIVPMLLKCLSDPNVIFIFIKAFSSIHYMLDLGEILSMDRSSKAYEWSNVPSI